MWEQVANGMTWANRDFNTRLYVGRVHAGEWFFIAVGKFPSTPREEALRFASAEEAKAYAETWATLKGVK